MTLTTLPPQDVLGYVVPQGKTQYLDLDIESNLQQLVDAKSQGPQTRPSGENIITILKHAASTPYGLTIHTPGDLEKTTTYSYQQLYEVAQSNAKQLQALPGWQAGRMCLILLDQHYSNIRWFWSVVLAGGIPVMCPPYAAPDLPANFDHLNNLLSNPFCLTTRARLTNEFGAHAMDISQTYAIEELEFGRNWANRSLPASSVPSAVHSEDVSEASSDADSDYSADNAELSWDLSSIAAVMLTSGSSGNSKAVPLTHHQIYSCMFGKSHLYSREPNAVTLNWVGMDHVAALTEAHLRAMWSGVDQVHVEAQDIVTAPATFLEMLALHKVSSTFAPHFLLARIVDAVDANQLQIPEDLDLHHLKVLVSGGEACSTDVCVRFTHLLHKYGASGNIVVPGFGMTETGAGCIYNRSCPDSDVKENYNFTSVGHCVPGVEVRVTSLNDEVSASRINLVKAEEIGNMEIRGPIVFRGYLNNEAANKGSFTPDGWFRTGDMGFIDRHGALVLTGRSKDVICINGVKHLPVDQERIIEEAKIPGVEPDHVVCFAFRPAGAHTESCCVIYQHSYDVNDKEARAKAQKAITKTFLMSTGARPHVLPLPAGILQKSTLGKLSRAKIGLAFEQGVFAEEDARNAADIRETTVAANVRPTDADEEAVLNIVASTLQLNPSEFGVETDYFEVGMTSVDLFRMRSHLCKHFGVNSFSIEIMIRNSTARTLKQAILDLSNSKASHYQPVVQLKASGSKTPLWLIHPGVGEVLVFLGLANQVQDRPVYALRARGFEDGDEVFTTIDEVVTTYIKAIKTRQPHGPYAIAGYSYGSMLAFEITKRLEAMGDNVPFLGAFNLPPHIKYRMRQLSSQLCLLNLAMFLQLLSDEESHKMMAESGEEPFEQLMDTLLAKCDQARFRELDLSRAGLTRWAYLAQALQGMAVDYDPSGLCENIDVFYCDPLKEVASSKQQWLDEKLSRWTDFCRSAPRYHSVSGAHYTMLSNAHVRSFSRILENVLTDRGI